MNTDATSSPVLLTLTYLRLCEMETEDLQYIGSDPGAVKHGNFINYYTFHSVTQRVDNLHHKMFSDNSDTTKPILCLDIGCNTGDLTKELRKYLMKMYPKSMVYFLALDIDPKLIQRAEESNSDCNISYETLNIMNEDDCEIIRKYLHTHQSKTFDITFCFSVTMWIHLNNGDDGLLKFLQYIKSISDTIIIEPQPWNCYRNAQRRVKKSGDMFPLYESLKIRSNVDSVIEKMLLDKSHVKIYESPTSSWNRKIQSYHRKNTVT